jgi:hypothetical protein
MTGTVVHRFSSSSRIRRFYAKHWKSVTAAALWLATTGLAAAIGVVVASYSGRAVPYTAIAGVGISDFYNKRFGESQIATVPLQDELFQDLKESWWLKDIRDPSLNLKSLLETLKEAQTTNDGFIRGFDYLKKALPEMRQSAARVRIFVSAD